MNISLSFYIDFIPFPIESGVNDVLNLFSEAVNYTHISKA